MTRVGGTQREHTFRLVLAVACTGQQALKEATAEWAELRESLGQLLGSALRITGRLMVFAAAALASHRARKKPMASRHDERSVMDDEFVFGRPHRDRLSDQTPRCRIEVVSVDHKALSVDAAVDDLGVVERPRRQRYEVGLFLGVSIHRTCLGVAMDVHIGDLGQPPGGRLVQVLQGMEAPATEQAGFDISKMSFNFSLGLGPPGPTGDWSKTVVGRERQEPCIVDGFIAVVPAHHDFHVVIKTGCRDSA